MASAPHRNISPHFSYRESFSSYSFSASAASTYERLPRPCSAVLPGSQWCDSITACDPLRHACIVYLGHYQRPVWTLCADSHLPASP
jgi:hypothetical protein